MHTSCACLCLMIAAGCGSPGSSGSRQGIPSLAPGPIAVAADRAEAFAGESIAVLPQDHVVGPLRVEPALPAGLALDAATGAITGQGQSAIAPTLYRVIDRDGHERRIVLEVVAPPTADDRFVAPDGDDAADGTRVHPMRTIRHALDGATAGRRVFLATGRYREDVLVQRLEGAADRPIVIRTVPGARASIEGDQPTIHWQRGTGPDEWVSTESFAHDKNNAMNRGAFVDRVPYTRLLTYNRSEDLLAANQRWSKDGVAPGGRVLTGPQRPWTYMGPGLWHDPATGQVHVRLSATTNQVPGLEDYNGPTDPQAVAIAVWSRRSTPLKVDRSSYIEIRDIVIFGGGDRSVIVDHADHVTFDHVDILAATMGLTIGDSTAITYVNGHLDGGIPSWSFRSDYKDNYKVQADDGGKEDNNLVRKTSRALLYVAGGNSEIDVANSELENAHDVYMAGVHSSLHHCLIRNIQDESLFIGHTKDIDDLRIHHNVIQRVMSAVTAKVDRESGSRLIYRNVFDLREPIAGFRPGGPNPDVWRWGHLFKGGIASTFYFYQNTVLLPRPDVGKPALWHYHAFEKEQPSHFRWFVNNLIVVGGSASPLAFVPDSGSLAAKDADGRPLLYSDGNAWVRMDAPNRAKRNRAGGKAPLFRCIAAKGQNCTVSRWGTLDEVHSTGFELHSRVATRAGFVRMKSLDGTAADDDLRPAGDSPARGVAVDMPADLPDDDRGSHDAGALAAGAPPLRVGVDGRYPY